MGMDVFGKQPEDHRGEYFRSSIWTWPAVYLLTLTLCSDLLDVETMQGMAVNDGVGPDDGEVCKQMAVRVQEWLQKNPGGYRVMVDHERTLEGKAALQLQQAGFEVCLHVPTASREADHEHLLEWATFLQHCGGFSVW